MFRTVPMLRDAVIVGLAFLACMGAGIAINFLKQDPLPLAYKPRAHRLPTDSQIPTVSLADITSDDRKKASVFIDAREPDFFEDGHLPGAINIPASRVSGGDFRGFPPDPATPLIVYCSGRNCPDSHLVASALVAKGFQNVSVFAGGWDEWSASGNQP